MFLPTIDSAREGGADLSEFFEQLNLPDGDSAREGGADLSFDYYNLADLQDATPPARAGRI